MKKFVRTISDYPIDGVQFRDITPLLQDYKLFAQIIDEMVAAWSDKKIDAILASQIVLYKTKKMGLMIIKDGEETSGKSNAKYRKWLIAKEKEFV